MRSSAFLSVQPAFGLLTEGGLIPFDSGACCPSCRLHHRHDGIVRRAFGGFVDGDAAAFPIFAALLRYYWTFLKSVFAHFGHGGSVSVESSSRTLVPHFVQL